MKNLINWKEMSRVLTGNETSISRNRIPKKYQSDVNDLILTIKAWAEKKEEKESTPETSSNPHQ